MNDTVITNEPNETIVTPEGVAVTIESQPLSTTIERSDDSTVVTVQENTTVIETVPAETMVQANPSNTVITIGETVTVIDNGGILSISRQAATSVSAYRAVYINSADQLVYGDSSLISDTERIIGITTSAAVNPDFANVTLAGEIQNAGWTFSSGLPVFLSTSGNLTQTPPTSGISIVLGTATSSDKMIVDIKSTIQIEI